jgi:hypothetical protein
MSSRVVKVLGIILSVFAVFYFGYQIYFFMYTPYDTQVAMLYHYSDQVELNGIVVKSEQIIEGAANGVVKYEYSNSQKIGSGSVVATVYQSENDLLNHDLLDTKNSYLDLLESLESKKSSIRNNTQSVGANVKENQIELLLKLKNSEFSDMEKSELQFLESLLKQDMIINSDISYSEAIAALQSEISQLEGSISQAVSTITAPVTGYFTSDVDGFEQLYTADVLNDLTPVTVENLIKNTKPAENLGGIGKIVTSSEWKFLALVKTKDADRFQQGKTISLTFSNTEQVIPASIEQVNYQKDSEYSVLVLGCNIMNEDVINLRKETPSAVFETGTGLRVPSSAIRVQNVEEEQEDGSVQTVAQPGVYINMGQVVKFKKLDIIYETKEYAVSSIKADTDYLQLYDEIILEGSDLYDNKPIR